MIDRVTSIVTRKGVSWRRTRALVGAYALVTLPGDAKECCEGRSFNPRVVGSSPHGPTIMQILKIRFMQGMSHLVRSASG
jgi:hypothetical protein